MFSKTKLSFLWQKNNPENPHGSIEPPAYEGDAGFNLHVSEEMELRPFIPTKIPCNISIAVPEGFFAIPIARSSAVNKGVMVFPTLIDSGYRGPVFVFAMLCTVEVKPVVVVAGMSIAQLILVPNSAPAMELLQVTALPTSQRGTNGFGSSGRSI